MKRRSTMVAVALLCLFSMGASAQTRGTYLARSQAKVVRKAEAPTGFGSVERTKLLEQVGRGRGAKDETLRFGSVERRAALTGKSVHRPKPLSERNNSRRFFSRR